MTIIKSYQEECAMEPRQVPSTDTAVVGSVHSDGIALIFPGETLESHKHYAYNAAVTFQPGQRVHLTRIGTGNTGTYIVEYPIGGRT